MEKYGVGKSKRAEHNHSFLYQLILHQSGHQLMPLFYFTSPFAICSSFEPMAQYFFSSFAVGDNLGLLNQP